MVNRKRLLCTALSCLLSFSNLSVSHASIKNSYEISKIENSLPGKLNENQIYKLMIGCLDNADNAIKNMNYNKPSGYMIFPSCDGNFAVKILAIAILFVELLWK